MATETAFADIADKIDELLAKASGIINAVRSGGHLDRTQLSNAMWAADDLLEDAKFALSTMRSLDPERLHADCS